MNGFGCAEEYFDGVKSVPVTGSRDFGGAVGYVPMKWFSIEWMFHKPTDVLVWRPRSFLLG